MSYKFMYGNKKIEILKPSENTWTNLLGKPSEFVPSNHSHNYATWLGSQYASGGDWMGWYSSYGGSRRGYIQHNGGQFSIVNETGGDIYTNCHIKLDRSLWLKNEMFVWGYNTSGVYKTLIVNGSNNIVYCGDSSEQLCLRGTKVYLGSNGATVTSDKNLKYDIEPIHDKYMKLFKKLKPITFKYINGNAKRPHIGFVAQDIEESLIELNMTSKDFAGLCIDKATRTDTEGGNWDGTYLVDNGFDKMYTLVYEEFIALNTLMIQKLYQQVDQQQIEIDDLKNNVKELITELTKRT